MKVSTTHVLIVNLSKAPNHESDGFEPDSEAPAPVAKAPYTPCSKKKPLIFDYNSRNSWSVFIIPALVEKGMNIPQCYVIYLLNSLMTS